MEIKGQRVVNSPVEAVWAALNDADTLARCTPGCKSLETVGDSRYAVTLELGIPLVKGEYSGELAISDKVVNSSYKIDLQGEGALGFVRASGQVSLEAVEDAKTQVSYLVDAQIGGRIAGVAQRLMGGIARQLAGRFFDALDRDIQEANSG